MSTYLAIASLSLLLACGPLEPTLLTTQPLSAGDATQVSFLPTDGASIIGSVSVAFELTADSRSPALVPLRLSSDLDGELWVGNVRDDRPMTWTGELGIGEHELTIEILDSDAEDSRDTISVTVRDNTDPECEILSPTDGQRVLWRSETVLFEAEVFDVDGDELDILWRSSIEGGLALGSRFERIMLVRGEHVITLDVTDGFGGSCRDQVLLIVE